VSILLKEYRRNATSGSFFYANITPDDWERIARYLTGEAGSAEAEANRALGGS